MKKLILFVSIVIGNILLAQSPQFINYQAVIRDANGGVIANQTIGLKLEITQGQSTYTEILSIGTNNLGLVNLQLGQNPAPNSIPFSDINWAAGNASLTTWYDPTNSLSNWQNIGTSNLASVPYALYAENVFSGDFNDLTNVPNLDTSISNELQSLSYSGDTIFLSNGGGFVYFPTFSGDFNDLTNIPSLDTSNTNELQALSQSGDTISLSNGGGAVVVSSFSGDFGDLVNVPSLDTSNTNELQVLSISGDTIFLSGGGYALLPSDKWSELNGVIFRNSKVGINTSSPLSQLDVSSASNVAANALGISITRQISNNGWGVPLRFNALDNTNQYFRYSQIAGGILNNVSKTGFISFGVADGNQWGVNYEQEKMRLTPTGLGIGTSSPQRELHIAGALRLAPSQSPPSNSAKGDIYFNSNGDLYYFNGSDWVTPLQQLTLNNDTLELSNAGYVVLPQSTSATSLDDLNDAISSQSKLALGVGALNSTSTSSDNVAVGMSSLASVTSGESNAAFGSNSMAGNLTGSHNTAVGYFAMRYNTASSGNTGVGSRVMISATGSDNSAFGAQALSSSSGNGNIAFGNGAQYNTTSGSLNNAIGYNTLSQTTTGSGNTAVGHTAMNGNVTGSNNVAIGYNANVGDTALTNAIAIGYNSVVAASNSIQLGNSAITNVNTFGALRAGDTASSVQDKGLLVYGSTSGPTGPTGQFIRSKDRNNVLTFLDLDEENGGSVGLLSTIYRGSNVVGISAKNASGWTQPLIVELGARTNSLVIKESQSVELIDGTIVKRVTDTSAINESAALEVKSNSKGFLPPRMSASQRDAISNPTIGLEVYCTDCGQGGSLSIYNGSNWTLVNQQLSITGDTLRLTNSNYVILPTTGQSVQSLDDLNDAISNSTQLAIGSGALNSTTTATDNVAIGLSALTNINSGGANIAIGTNTMRNVTTGNHNTAIGYHALYQNIIGSRNTALGSRAMFYASGSDNIALGEQALYSSSGGGNIAVGNGSLYGNSTGGSNTAVGYGSMGQNTTGGGNTSVGSNALSSNITGSNNLALGNNANVGSQALTNAIAIGYNSVVAASNSIQLGNSAITNVNTFGALRAGDTASSVQDKGLLVYGSTSGPTGPTGQFIRSKDRNNVLTFLDLDEENGGSVGLYSTSYQGTNFVGISAKNASGWTRPLIVELGASTNSLVIKESESIELVDGTIVKEISDTTTVSESAALEIKSTTKGLLFPRMTQAQRDAIQNPVAGLAIFCLDIGNGELQVYNGTQWLSL